MASVITVTDDNWKEEIEDHNDGLVLVDIWASWCGACKQLIPVVKKIAADHPGFKVCQYKLDDSLKKAEELEITSIPALVLFRNGEMITFVVGYSPKSKIEEALELEKYLQ